MEGLAGCSVGGRFLLRLPSPSNKSRSLSCRRSGFSCVFASRDGPELDKWDQMELKFGRLLGEDPKLTLAKIMTRKSNPDVSYLDVEKSFDKKKGKLEDYMINIPKDINAEGQPSISSNRTYFSNQKSQNMPREGNLNLSRPIMNKGIKAMRQDEKPALTETQTNRSHGDIDKSGTSNITLRKPSAIHGDDIELDKYSNLKIKPNLFLKMRKDSIENFSDVALQKKPEVMKMSSNPDRDSLPYSGSTQSSSNETRTPDYDVKLLNLSEISRDKLEMTDEVAQNNSLDSSTINGMTNMTSDAIEGPSDNSSEYKSSIQDDGLDLGLQPPRKRGVVPHDVEASTTSMDHKNISGIIPRKAALVGKPQRVDSSAKKASHSTGTETVSLIDESHNISASVDHFIPEEHEEHEDSDWKRVVHLLHTGERDEVELVSCSGRGFVVSFGSLIGFLPYRNLGAKWKFLAFESWLRRKGLDPSMYRKNLSILGSYDVQNNSLGLDSNKDQETGQKDEEILPPNMKFEDLLEVYDQEKTKFLSSFIGQKIRVSVVVADRNSRRLLFSGRPKEKEEVVEKKRILMAKLSVGDVVKCCIKKITYFGIFVEVEGVPALIHQSEVSWDAISDPSSFYKIDQIIEAKVHQLDYARERITLSLREITPDPLMEALETVVGDHTSMGENLPAVQADVEWADVESLIKELQQIDGVHSVSKGRFLLSPGLAPTFQVYMASVFENQYKLLARYENKVQEVVVQAALDKEQMKAAILTCTNRVG